MGKVALITGADSGMGSAVAIAFSHPAFDRPRPVVLFHYIIQVTNGTTLTTRPSSPVRFSSAITFAYAGFPSTLIKAAQASLIDCVFLPKNVRILNGRF